MQSSWQSSACCKQGVNYYVSINKNRSYIPFMHDKTTLDYNCYLFGICASNGFHTFELESGKIL